MLEGITYKSKCLYSWVSRAMGEGDKTVAMTTSEAVRIIERAGMTVVFTDGAWLVTMWEGCEEHLTRRDLITLATDLAYITK